MSTDIESPFNEPQTQPEMQHQSSGNGCLWGCLIAVGVVVAMCVCAGVGTYWMVSRTIAEYTSDTPMELPTVAYDKEKLAELNNRMKSFRDALDAGETPEEDLILSADDINALIADNKDLRGRVFVKIEDDQVKGDVSIPLDKIPGGKGRFLNGSGTFDVSMDNGFLVVTAEEMEVNGNPVPEAFMEGMRRENLAKDIYKNPENREFLRKFEDIHVEGDKILLRVKHDEADKSHTESSDETSSETNEVIPIDPVTPAETGATAETAGTEVAPL